MMAQSGRRVYDNPGMTPPLAIVQQFVACINAADVEGLARLMTEDHRFIDATGAGHAGRDQMKVGWTQYFRVFPNYRVEIESAIVEGNTVAAFGSAAGSFQGNPEKAWEFPAAFRATLVDGLISEWRIYADIEQMVQSMGIRRF